MRYTKYIIIISILIILAAFFANADFASAKICVNDKDCGSNQRCKDVLQANMDPDTIIKTTTKTCVDSCPPKERTTADNYCPNPPEDKNYTCVNYTCIRLEEPLPPVPGTEITSLDSYIKYIYQIALGVVGLAALIMLILGGITYMTAAGNASQMSDAKDRIQNAILGLILALSAYLILYTINPDLVRLRPVQLSYPVMPKTVLSCENNQCVAKIVAPKDIKPDTKNTCGEVGTECPPSCRLINVALKPDIIQVPANKSSTNEKIKGIIEMRGSCENESLSLTITLFKSKIGDFAIREVQKIFSTPIQDLAGAKFTKGFPYNTWTFDLEEIGEVDNTYWFTASLIESWSDTVTHSQKTNQQTKNSSSTIIKRSGAKEILF